MEIRSHISFNMRLTDLTVTEHLNTNFVENQFIQSNEFISRSASQRMLPTLLSCVCGHVPYLQKTVFYTMSSNKKNLLPIISIFRRNTNSNDHPCHLKYKFISITELNELSVLHFNLYKHLHDKQKVYIFKLKMDAYICS